MDVEPLLFKDEIEIEEFTFPLLETENDEVQPNETKDKCTAGSCDLGLLKPVQQASSNTNSSMDCEPLLFKDEIEIEEFTFPPLETEIDEAQTNETQHKATDRSDDLGPLLSVMEVSSNTKSMDFEDTFVKDEIEIEEFTFPPLETKSDEVQPRETQDKYTVGSYDLGPHLTVPQTSSNTNSSMASDNLLFKDDIEIEEFTFPPMETDMVHINEAQSNESQDKPTNGSLHLGPHLPVPQTSANTNSSMASENLLFKDDIEIEEFTFPPMETDVGHIDEAQANEAQEKSTDGSLHLAPHLPVSQHTTSTSKERSSTSAPSTSPSIQKPSIRRTKPLIYANSSNNKNSRSRNMTCSVCKFKFGNETLEEHCTTLHTVTYISMGAKTYQRPFRVLHCKVVDCMWKTTSVCFDQDELISQIKIHSQTDHNNMFVCEYCLGMFENRAKFCDHNKKYHSNHKCEFSINNSCDCPPVEEVVTVAPTVKNLIKTICGVSNCKWSTTTSDKKELLSEVRKHIELSHNYLYPCSYCLNIFTSIKQRNTHVMEKHMKSCGICDFKHIFDAALLAHCSATHTVPSNVSMVSVIEPIEPQYTYVGKPKKVKQTLCQFKDCNFSLMSKEPAKIFALLKSHCATYHNGGEVCKHCFKMFQSVTELELHVDNNHVFPCKICSCAFTSELRVFEHCKSEHRVPSNWNCNTELLEEEIIPVENVEHVAQGFESSMLSNQEVQISCLICGCKLYKANLILHNTTFHLVSTDIDMSKINFTTPLIRKFQCKKCLLDFTRLYTLKNHYSKVHQIKLLCFESDTEYSCTLCCHQRLKSSDLNFIQHHLQNVHQQEFDTKLTDFTNWYTPIINEQSMYENSLIFNCKLCSDFCTSFHDLTLHYSYIHSCYACGKCKAVFQSENQLSIHWQEVHYVTCNMCGLKTKSCLTLIGHLSTAHKKIVLNNRPTTTQNANSDIKCNLCPTNHIMTSKCNTKMHYFYFHNKYACEYCWQTFHGLKAVHKHVLDNHITECIHCNCKFDDLKTLTTHLAVHQNEKCNFCEFCGESFNDRNALKIHRESHDQRKKNLLSRKRQQQTNLLCSKCGSKFLNKKTYEKHMANLHPVSDINCGNFCKLCNKKYKNITLHRYISHKEIYMKENGPQKCEQFQCSFCKTTYDSVSKLLAHMKRHSKYKCKQCPMQYSLLPHLEEHVTELHTNRYAYSCSVCSKVLPSEADFDLHTSFHSTDTQFQPELLPVLRCDLCDHFCLNRDAMETHVKSKHIKAGKLINVKRKKPLGRKPYIKRVF